MGIYYSMLVGEEMLDHSPNGSQEDWEEKVGRAIKKGKIKAGDICRVWTECWWSDEGTAISRLCDKDVAQHDNTISSLGEWLQTMFNRSGDPNALQFKQVWDTTVSEIPPEALEHDLSPLVRRVFQTYIPSPLSNSILCALDQGVVFPIYNRLLHIIWQPWMSSSWETISWKIFILPTPSSIQVVHVRTDANQSHHPSISISYNIVMSISKNDASLISTEFNLTQFIIINSSWRAGSRIPDLRKVVEDMFPAAEVILK